MTAKNVKVALEDPESNTFTISSDEAVILPSSFVSGGNEDIVKLTPVIFTNDQRTLNRLQHLFRNSFVVCYFYLVHYVIITVRIFELELKFNNFWKTKSCLTCLRNLVKSHSTHIIDRIYWCSWNTVGFCQIDSRESRGLNYSKVFLYMMMLMIRRWHGSYILSPEHSGVEINKILAKIEIYFNFSI